MTTDPDRALRDARARVLHDLSATLPTSPQVIDALDNAIRDRRGWVEPWPDGASFLACLVAQDVQEAIAPAVGRWPRCRTNGDHTLHVAPDLGDDPHWVCEGCSAIVAAVGEL